MKRRTIVLAAFAVVTGALALTVAAARGPSPDAAKAASHREAPLISEDPVADNTDVYAFVTPDAPNTVTLIANYIPFEEPAGGPNFFKFGDDVLYTIHVDNNGDAISDIDYEFDFNTRIENPNTFLYNTGPIGSLDDPDWNVKQFYSVTRSERTARGRAILPGRRVTLGENLKTPPVNVGPRSTPNYEALAAAAVTTLDGGVKVFAGQRDDPFFVDLGSVFDLLGLRPFNPFHLIPLPAEAGVDGVGGYNVHTIAIQVPKDQLVGANTTIGVYATAKRPQTRVLQRDITRGDQQFGPMVQVSRLANPLVNEVFIPIGEKDQWNRDDPVDDAAYVDEFSDAEVPALVNLLYPALPDARTTGRTDLVGIFLTGLAGFNFTGPTPADLLRLNTTIAPTAAICAGNRLGPVAGDLAGWPNGRRLEDDVTDVEIRAAADGYGPVLASLFGLPNLSPNNTLGDGVDKNDKPCLASFPYVPTPHQGYDHDHHVTP